MGVLVAAPDINELTRKGASHNPFGTVRRIWRFFWHRRVRALRIFLLGITPDFHGTREGAAIVELMLDMGKDAAERYGATHIQMGWTLRSNRRVNRMIEIWAPGAQRVVHRIWQYQLASTVGQAAVNGRSENSA